MSIPNEAHESLKRTAGWCKCHGWQKYRHPFAQFDEMKFCGFCGKKLKK